MIGQATLHLMLTALCAHCIYHINMFTRKWKKRKIYAFLLVQNSKKVNYKNQSIIVDCTSLFLGTSATLSSAWPSYCLTRNCGRRSVSPFCVPNNPCSQNKHESAELHTIKKKSQWFLRQKGINAIIIEKHAYSPARIRIWKFKLSMLSTCGQWRVRRMPKQTSSMWTTGSLEEAEIIHWNSYCNWLFSFISGGMNLECNKQCNKQIIVQHACTGVLLGLCRATKLSLSQ